MVTQRYRITTRSGSVYVVRQGASGFVLEDDTVNVPNAFSPPVVGAWKLSGVLPWPPEVGSRLLLQAVQEPPEHRMPGGGKLTSPVTEVQAL